MFTLSLFLYSSYDYPGVICRSLKENCTNSRRIIMVTNFTGKLSASIRVITFSIITITHTTAYITTYIVISTITKIRINPGTKVCVVNLISRFIDDLIIIKCHVINSIIGLECKTLFPYFKTNSNTTRFSMCITNIINNPP